MARAALGLGIRELADASQTSTDTILRLERGDTLRPRTVAAVRSALEAAGVEFIPENGGGAGVRLRKGEEPNSASEQPHQRPKIIGADLPVVRAFLKSKR